MAALEFLGLGQSKEFLHLEVVSDAVAFIHAEGNECSPFEFNGDNGKTAEYNARLFAQLIVKFRLEERMESITRGSQDE